MPTKGNINIVADEQIWRDHIKTGENFKKSTYLVCNLEITILLFSIFIT